MTHGRSYSNDSGGNTCANRLIATHIPLPICLLGLLACLSLLAVPVRASAATYYIDYASGNDANNGTSTSTPWQRAPGMQGVSGNAASHTITAGDNFIFKGGVTWPNSTMGWGFIFTSPSTSTSAVGCSGSGCVYLGTDKTWYSSANCSAKGYSGFCRPVFDAQAAEVAPSEGGALTNIMLDVYGGANGYIVVDDLEFTGFFQGDDTSNSRILQMRCSTHCEFKNLYVHGWSHGGTATHDNSQIIGGNLACPPDYTSSVHDNVFDGSDTTDDMMMAMKGGPAYFYNNYVADMHNGLIGFVTYTWNNTFLHINGSFDATSHGNVIESAGCQMIAYDNYISDSTGGATLFNTPVDGSVDYDFNNVIVKQQNEAIQIDNNGLTTGSGSGIYVFNNTIQSPAGVAFSPIDGPSRSGYPNLSFMTVQNNHLIADNPTVNFLTHTSTTTETNDVEQTNAQAAGAGYASTSTYAYSPPGGSGITVNAGANLTSLCSSIPSSTLANTSAACMADTTYGVGYDAVNHVVIVPNRSSNARPGTGSWDSGAYEYTTSTPPTFSIMITGGVTTIGSVLVL